MLPDSPDETDGFMCDLCGEYDFKSAVVCCPKCKKHLCSMMCTYQSLLDPTTGETFMRLVCCGVIVKTGQSDYLKFETPPA